MADQYSEVSGAPGDQMSLGAPSAETVNDVDGINGCVDWKNSTWLLSSRSTASSEMGGDVTPEYGEERSLLHRDSCTPAHFSVKLHAYASTKEVDCTTAQVTDNGVQISCGIAPDRLSTMVAKHLECEAVLEKATTMLTSEKWREAEEGQQKVAIVSKRRSSLTDKHASAEMDSVRLKRPRPCEELHGDILMLAERGPHGSSEDPRLPLRDPENTTASSSRRRSGLSQADGTRKCLEELVVHVEEELAEQHLHFDRLQSFCEVVADEDYEFVPFGCTLEFSASGEENTQVQEWSQCWDTAPASLPKLGKMSITRHSKLHCVPCNSDAFAVDPPDTVGVHALGVLDEKSVEEKVHLIRESAEEFIETVDITTSADASPASTDVHGTLTLATVGSASALTGEQFSTPPEGPSCISCGCSMSCHRCYTRVAVSVKDALLQSHNGVSRQLLSRETDPGILLACRVHGDKCSQLSVSEGGSKGTGCFLSGGVCGGCASNIYCLTCLEHMQEQTAGLHALADEGGLQVPYGRELTERRPRVEFATLLAFPETLSHFVFTKDPSGGRRERIQVGVRPERLPYAAHSVGTLPASTSAKARTWLGCKLVGIHEMVGRYALRACTNCPAITDKKGGDLQGINSTCRVPRGPGSAGETLLRYCKEADERASLHSVNDYVRSLRVRITRDTPEKTWFVPVCILKAHEGVQEDSERRKSVTFVHPSLHAVKRKASWCEGSQGLQPRERLHVTGAYGGDSPAESMKPMDCTDVGDVSRLTLERTCAQQLRACAQYKAHTSIIYAKANEGEQECLIVCPNQKALTQKGLKCEKVIHLSRPSRDLQGLKQAGFNVDTYSPIIRGHALQVRVDHAACFFTQERDSYDRCAHGESHHRVSLSCSEKQDNAYFRECCSSAARFSLVHQHRVEGAVFMHRRSGHACGHARAQRIGPCFGLNNQALTPSFTDALNALDVSRSKECNGQLHRVAPRKCSVTLSSVAARQQVEGRTRVSAFPYTMGARLLPDGLRWQQDTRPLQLCSRRVSCSGSSSHPPSLPVLEARKPSTRLEEQPEMADVDFDDPQALLEREASFRTTSSVCDNVDEPAGGKWEARGRHAASSSVLQQNRSQKTHVCSLAFSRPDAIEEREGEESIHTDDNCALIIRKTERITEAGKWIEWDESKTVNSALFCKQKFCQTACNTSVSFPAQTQSDLTCEAQCDGARWEHRLSSSELASLCAQDRASSGAAMKCTGPSWKERENTMEEEENSQQMQASDSVAVATLSGNMERLDSPCTTTKLPSLLNSGLRTTSTAHAAAAIDNLSKQKPGLVVHDWEVGKLGSVTTTSEFEHGGSTCSAVDDRSTTIALSEHMSETVSFCACDGRECTVLRNQVEPASVQQRLEGEGYFIENDTHQSQAIQATKCQHLEVPSHLLPTSFSARQGEQLTCSWSARLPTATVSIGSNISTRSSERGYGPLSFKTPPGYSRGENIGTGVSNSAPEGAIPADWNYGGFTRRVLQEQNDKQSMQSQLPSSVILQGKHHEPDLSRQPLSTPFVVTLEEAASKCHSSVPGGTHAADAFEVASVTPAAQCDGKVLDVRTEAIQPSALHAIVLEDAVPSSCTVNVGALPSLSPHVTCTTSCYGGVEHSARKGTPLTGRAGPPAWGVEGSERNNRIGHCASQEDTNGRDEQTHTDEQLINNWVSWQEERALHPRRSAAGVLNWQPALTKLPDTADLHSGQTMDDGRDISATVPPSFAHLSSPQCFAPSCYSDALPVSVEQVPTPDEDPLCSVGSQKNHADMPMEDSGKRFIAEAWKECSTPESFRTATTVSPHSPRRPRNKSRSGMSHRRDNTVKEGTALPSDTKTHTVTDIADYGKRREEQECEQSLIKLETVTSSATVGVLQNLHSVKRNGKSAPTAGGNVTGTGCQGALLEFGAGSDFDDGFEGLKRSRMAHGTIPSSWGNKVVEKGQSVSSGACSFSDITAPTADPDSGGVTCSSAPLTEPCNVRGGCRRRALPEQPMEVIAGEAGANRVVCRAMDDRLLSAERTRKSWRRGSDGKVLNDAGGHKISGVWYDTGRRLWRVVFTQGERRRTKGFSLKQYGFEQARNMAVQCKLAIEARKALCENEIA